MAASGLSHVTAAPTTYLATRANLLTNEEFAAEKARILANRRTMVPRCVSSADTPSANSTGLARRDLGHPPRD
jgi:hypothetical protein